MVSELMLDRFLADDVNAEQRARIEAEIAASPELAAHVAALRAERAQFLQERPPELMAARIAQQVRGRTTVRIVRTSARRVHWLGPALATAASVSLVFKLWPHPEAANTPPPPASIVSHDIAPPPTEGYAQPPGTPPLASVAGNTKPEPRSASPSKKSAADRVFKEGGTDKDGSLDDRFADAFSHKRSGNSEAPSVNQLGGAGASRGELAAAPPAAPPPAAASAVAPKPSRAIAESEQQRDSVGGASNELRPAARAALAKEKAMSTEAAAPAEAEVQAQPAASVEGKFVRASGAARVGDAIDFNLSAPAYAVVITQSGNDVGVVFDSSHARITRGQLAVTTMSSASQTLWLFAATDRLDVPGLVASLRAHHPQRPQAVLPLHVAQ